MKTKLLLLFIVLFSFGSSCEPEEQTQSNCTITYFLFVPTVGGVGGEFIEQFSEPIDFDCVNNEYGYYYEVSNINYNYAKVDCDCE